jgi:ketosteroid isomerase-like protein
MAKGPRAVKDSALPAREPAPPPGPSLDRGVPPIILVAPGFTRHLGVRLSRLTHAALCATLLASACKVERTPPEYIDHRQPIADIRGEAAEELQDRLLAMGQALNRGDSSEALQALSPTADAYVIAADGDAVLTGDEQIAGALVEFASLQGTVSLSDVLVKVGPRANVAWFRAQLVHSGATGGKPVRITGVYLRGDEGEWRLVQAHLSTSASAAPDSLAPDSLPPSPAAGEAPPAGE